MSLLQFFIYVFKSMSWAKNLLNLSFWKETLGSFNLNNSLAVMNNHMQNGDLKISFTLKAN